MWSYFAWSLSNKRQCFTAVESGRALSLSPPDAAAPVFAPSQSRMSGELKASLCISGSRNYTAQSQHWYQAHNQKVQCTAGLGGAASPLSAR